MRGLAGTAVPVGRHWVAVRPAAIAFVSAGRCARLSNADPYGLGSVRVPVWMLRRHAEGWCSSGFEFSASMAGEQLFDKCLGLSSGGHCMCGLLMWRLNCAEEAVLTYSLTLLVVVVAGLLAQLVGTHVGAVRSDDIHLCKVNRGLLMW